MAVGLSDDDGGCGDSEGGAWIGSGASIDGGWASEGGPSLSVDATAWRTRSMRKPWIVHCRMLGSISIVRLRAQM